MGASGWRGDLSGNRGVERGLHEEGECEHLWCQSLGILSFQGSLSLDMWGN